jgi:hypothetical protein
MHRAFFAEWHRVMRPRKKERANRRPSVSGPGGSQLFQQVQGVNRRLGQFFILQRYFRPIGSPAPIQVDTHGEKNSYGNHQSGVVKEEFNQQTL